MIFYPRSTIGITFAISYCFVITIPLALICGVALFQGTGPEETYRLPSPDGKFTLITDIWRGDALSNYTCTIKVESQHGESKHIGDLEGLWNNPAHWRKNNVVCITYINAAKADFEERFIELDKQIIQIDVESGSLAFKSASPK